MTVSLVDFPLPLQRLRDRLVANQFPARHGRVTLVNHHPSNGSLDEDKSWSAEYRRFLTSIHYEFCEFHRRINEPLESSGVSPESILGDYLVGLTNRLERAKNLPNISDNMGGQLARAGLVLEMLHICLLDAGGMSACKFPRSIIRHGEINLEKILMEIENFFERIQDDDGMIVDKMGEKMFWDNVQKLALLDLSPVISSVLSKFLSSVNFRKNKQLMVGEYSANLLLAFYNEVPSLYDLAAAAAASSTGSSAADQLEKRRAYASVALHKDIGGSETSQFFWKLNIGDEADYALIRSAILDLTLPRIAQDNSDLSWYEKLGLVWCWLHVIDEPGEALSMIANDVASSSGDDFASTNVSVFDACIYAILTNDLLSLFTLIVSGQDEVFGGSWFSAIVSDLIFYTGADGGEVLGKLRDKLLMSYCRDLMNGSSSFTKLGVRMACDIIVTLGQKSASRGSEELMGRLASIDSTIPPPSIGRTKQWLLAVKLSHDHNIGGSSTLTESLCLEKFHSDSVNGRVVDAIQSLAVAAEVGKDVHVGACRISDYLDNAGEDFREKFHQASLASLGLLPSSGLLPEYIDSGRFQFLTELVGSGRGGSSGEEVSRLVTLVTSPDCPPENVVGLITEIRHALTSGQKSDTGRVVHLRLEEAVALSKALIDASGEASSSGGTEVLMNWIADEVINGAISMTDRGNDDGDENSG